MTIGNNFEKNSSMGLEKVGRGKATIFEGFCSKHDTLLFSSIENKDYQMNNCEQQFTFAYRALSREIIKKEEEKNAFSYLEDNKMLIYTMDNITWVKAIELGLSDLNKIKEIMDKSITNKKFDEIETIQLEIEMDSKFSVSSIFYLEYDFEGNAINDLSDINMRVKPLFLTIFPQNGKTYVLFSFLKCDLDTYTFLKNQIINLPVNMQTKRISLIVTLYCDNFVYSPVKWENIEELKKKEFISLFEKTIFLPKIDCMNLKPPIDFFE